MKRSTGIWAVIAVTGLAAAAVPTHPTVSAAASAGATLLIGAGENARTGAVGATESIPMLQPAFSDANTDKIVGKLQRGETVCQKLPSEYRVDCMAKTLRDAYQAASPPDYRGARKELQSAFRALTSLVKQNADPEKPAMRVVGRTYRPVQKSAVKSVNRQAIEILRETETRLLRSATSAKRKAHFQRIARAVGSTKKLFRS